MQPTRYKVLYFSIEENNLKLEEEYEAISEILQEEDPNVMLLPHANNVDADKLHARLNSEIRELAPDQKLIVQIAGHSDEFGFYLEGSAEDEHGVPKVCPDTAKKYFSGYSKYIDCIIFSSCKSIDLAIKILDINDITAAIGLTKYLESYISISFTKHFYQQFRYTRDFSSSLKYARERLILSKKEGYFWGEVKRSNKSHLEQLIAESSIPGKKLNQLNQLKDIIIEVKDVISIKTIDKSLYEKLNKIIASINDIEPGFVGNFDTPADFDPGNNKNKLLIYKWQQRLIFEYAVILATKIHELIFEEIYPEIIPKILNQLIENYELSVDFDYHAVLNHAEKMSLLREKAYEISQSLNKMRTKAIESADFYKAIFDFVNLIAANDFEEVERRIKYRLKTDETIRDLLGYINEIRGGHLKYQDRLTEIIPFNI